MDYSMSKSISTISLEMNIVRKLCKINEYKGQQNLFKNQSKSIIGDYWENAIEKFVYDTYAEEIDVSHNTSLRDLINNNLSPKTKEDIGVLEFRDVIKTINTAYDDMEVTSEMILQLHGYLHRYSLVRGN